MTMGEAMAVDPVIARMPRGGPTASWLDRRLQTDALEYAVRAAGKTLEPMESHQS
jgi:hypothetical protein